MHQEPSAGGRSRKHPRTPLAPMYTLIRVRNKKANRYQWSGHIYDISLSGARFELDESLEVGSEVEIRAMLPGHEHVTVHASGTIVRQHDNANEPGPVRMGLQFDRFKSKAEREKLTGYIERQNRKAA